VHVFTYGSLMFPAVWTRVVAGGYRALPALLRGFRRRRVRGQDYPALQHACGEDGAAAVPGIVYLDVTDADLAALDRFEGRDYRRIQVPVIVEPGVPGVSGVSGVSDGAGRGLARTTIVADTYLFIAANQVEAGDWDPETFERERMHRFLREYPPPRPAGS
jgi:Gamma-glutamyl cyclotransferase, AIG2-like